jgi:hypothetical protein
MRLASYRLYQLDQAFLLFSSSTLLSLHKIATIGDLMLWPETLHENLPQGILPHLFGKYTTILPEI